jgi:hypothetical protein
MSEGPRRDAAAIIDALEYVTALHQELTEENGAPPLGTQNQVVDFILADAGLTDYVRRWAARRRDEGPVPVPPERLPQDEAYRRVRARLQAAMDESVFRQPLHNPP